MKPQSIAVIGGVASGPAAAAEARRVDPEARIVLFEQGGRISYGACEIPYVLSGHVSDVERLVAFTPEAFERERGVEARVLTRVESIDPAASRLEAVDLRTGENSSERFDKFILATGATANRPDIDGADADNVFTVRDLDDADAIVRHVQNRTVHHAVVAGGGFIGVEVAEALTGRGVRVSMLQDHPGPLSRMLEPGMSRLVGMALERGGVTLRSDRLSAFRRSPSGEVTAVRTAGGELVGCQLVVLGTGIRPNAGLGTQAGLKIGSLGGYEVTKGMRTSISNVWACGDCVEVERIVDGRRVLSPLSLTAFRTGRVAGRNAARRGKGAPSRFEGVVRAQGIRVFEDEVACVGLTKKEAAAAGFSAATVTVSHRTRAALAPGSTGIHVTLVFDASRGRLLGGQLFGGPGTVMRGNVLVPLVTTGATVHDLYGLDLIYSPPFAPRLDPLLVAARKAQKMLGG